MKLVFLIFILVLSASRVLAGINLKLELEAKLQAKIVSLVTPLDPHAQVIVTVKIKNIAVELPGTGVSVSDSASAFQTTEFSSEDIESIDVVVLSKYEEFPRVSADWIKKSAELPGIKSKVSFQKTDVQTAEVKEAVSYDQKYLDQYAIYFEMVREHQNIFYMICAALLAVLLVSVFLVCRVYLAGVARIERAMKLSSEGNFRSAPQIIDAQPVRPQLTESRQSQDSDRLFIQSLSNESVAGLLSDCYWCEEDQYAIWLWLNLSPDQRTQVTQIWAYSHTYIKSLGGDAVAKTYHNHPYYLKPLTLWNVSQDDVGKWLKKNPSVWSMLSPMRQEKMDLPLMEKLGFLNHESSGVLPTLPAATPVSRTLQNNLAVNEVSESDELQIFKSYQSIPENVRKQIYSLVWLALLPNKDREEILSTMSAQQIAQAWIGPVEILTRLEPAVGEKKFKLLRDYISQIKPDRKSIAMQYLAQEALKRLSLIKDSGGQRAA
jgi:hypothetical protein